MAAGGGGATPLGERSSSASAVFGMLCMVRLALERGRAEIRDEGESSGCCCAGGGWEGGDNVAR